MSTNGCGDGGSPSIARLLEHSADAVVEHYEAQLVVVNSRIMNDPQMREEVLRQARSILSEVTRFVEWSDSDGRALGLTLKRDIDTYPGLQRIHPSESLRAALALFESIVGTASELVTSSPDIDPAELMRVTLAANRIIYHRIRLAATSYVGTLLNVVEQSNIEERKRLSREIHDRIGGNVAAAYRQAELLALRPEVGALAIRDRADRIDAALRSALDDLHQLNTELRSWEPRQGGLRESLEAYLDTLQPDGLVHRVTVNGDEGRLDAPVRGGAYLIVREAVRNAVRHAGAARLTVRMNITPRELYAVVEDDGCGWDVTADGDGGSGLSAMRERAALLGGQAVVTTSRGQGTRVELLLPLTGGEAGA